MVYDNPRVKPKEETHQKRKEFNQKKKIIIKRLWMQEMQNGWIFG